MGFDTSYILNEEIDVSVGNGEKPTIGNSIDISSKWMASLGYNHLGFFRAVRFPTGEIQAVFRASTSHSGNAGKLYHTRSSDEGKTWATPDLVYDPGPGKDPRDPALYLNYGYILTLTFFEYDTATQQSPVVVWRHSLDNTSPVWPTTWSSKYSIRPKEISRNHTGIIPIGSGRYMLPIYACDSIDDGKFNLYLYRSTAPQIPSAGDVSNWQLVYSTTDGTYDETAIHAIPYPNPSGVRLIMVVRKNNSFAVMKHSDDNGTTWVDDGEIKSAYRVSGGQLLFSAQGNVFMIHRTGDIETPIWLMKLDKNNIFRRIAIIENVGSGYPSIIESDDGIILFYTTELFAVSRVKMRKIKFL